MYVELEDQVSHKHLVVHRIHCYLLSVEGSVKAATHAAKLNRLKIAIEFLLITGKSVDSTTRVLEFKDWLTTLAKRTKRFNRE